MRFLTGPARVGIVDEDPFPDGFEVGDDQVVHHAVAKLGREDLPVFRFRGHEAGRRGWLISPGLKLARESKQILLQALLEKKGIAAPALAFAAAQVRFVNLFE